MKVTSVHLFPVYTPRETGQVSGHVIVKLTTDASVVGWGEMSDLDKMPDVAATEAAVNEKFVGLEIFDAAQLDARMQGCRDTGMPGFVGVGVELAVWDLRGKALSVPLYQLLGGAYRKRIRVCYPIFPCRSDEDAAANVERVGRIYERHGFDLFRYYGGVDCDADERFLDGVKSRWGDRINFKSLDLSRRLSWQDAVQHVQRLRKYGFMLCESPCRDVEGKARVREALNYSLPISEHVGSFAQAAEFAEKKAVDILNIAVCGGGIAWAKKMFTVAEALNLKTLIGTTQELSLGTSAQAHIGASVPNLDFPCDPAGPCLYLEDVAKERVRYEDGYLIVPDGPGLGIEVDEERLAALAVRIEVWADEGLPDGRQQKPRHAHHGDSAPHGFHAATRQNVDVDGFIRRRDERTRPEYCHSEGARLGRGAERLHGHVPAALADGGGGGMTG